MLPWSPSLLKVLKAPVGLSPKSKGLMNEFTASDAITPFPCTYTPLFGCIGWRMVGLPTKQFLKGVMSGWSLLASAEAPGRESIARRWAEFEEADLL